METKHWLIEGINEWRQLTRKYNWYTITFIYVYFEKENMAYGYEFIFTLLGLGFRVRYNTDRSLAQFEEWGKESEEALIEHYGETWTALQDK